MSIHSVLTRFTRHLPPVLAATFWTRSASVVSGSLSRRAAARSMMLSMSFVFFALAINLLLLNAPHNQFARLDQHLLVALRPFETGQVIAPDGIRNLKPHRNGQIYVSRDIE